MSKYYVSFEMLIEGNDDSYFWSLVDDASDLIVYYNGNQKLIIPVEEIVSKYEKILLKAFLSTKELAKITSMIMNGEESKIMLEAYSGEYVPNKIKEFKIQSVISYKEDITTILDISFLKHKEGLQLV